MGATFDFTHKLNWLTGGLVGKNTRNKMTAKFHLNEDEIRKIGSREIKEIFVRGKFYKIESITQFADNKYEVELELLELIGNEIDLINKLQAENEALKSENYRLNQHLFIPLHDCNFMEEKLKMKEKELSTLKENHINALRIIEDLKSKLSKSNDIISKVGKMTYYHE